MRLIASRLLGIVPKGYKVREDLTKNIPETDPPNHVEEIKSLRLLEETVRIARTEISRRINLENGR